MNEVAQMRYLALVYSNLDGRFRQSVSSITPSVMDIS